LEWLVKKQSSLDMVHHYLDDFIFVGGAGTSHCQTLLQTFHSLCEEMGIPLNPDKEQGPTTCLIFLGLEIDTLKMQIRIPGGKVSEICNILEHHLQKRTITLTSLQSIVGKLNFFSKAIPGSRAFIRRFYNAMQGNYQPYHHINISRPMKLDMQIWLEFLNHLFPGH
jgi:hypothetical protein